MHSLLHLRTPTHAILSLSPLQCCYILLLFLFAWLLFSATHPLLATPHFHLPFACLCTYYAPTSRVTVAVLWRSFPPATHKHVNFFACLGLLLLSGTTNRFGGSYRSWLLFSASQKSWEVYCSDYFFQFLVVHAFFHSCIVLRRLGIN